MAMQTRSSSVQRFVNTITGSGYHLDTYYRPGRSLNKEEKVKLQCELRELGKLAMPSVPNYQCFADSTNALDDKIIVLAREEGPNGRIVAFVSCILIEVADVGTVLHIGLTCIHPIKQRQGLQRVLHTRLWILLSRAYPQGMWFTNSASSPCGLVAMFEITKNVFPSPKLREPTDTHRLIAEAFSTMHREKADIEDDIVFDKERFVFHCDTDGVWYKDPYDARFHHKNTAVNSFYVKHLAQVPGSEILQIGHMDWAVHFPVAGYPIYVGNVATWHTIVTTVCASLSKISSLCSSMVQVCNSYVWPSLGGEQSRKVLHRDKEL